MIIDALLQFDDKAAHLAASKSTNILDIGNLRDLGNGTNLYLVVLCTTAMTDAGSDSTMTVDLETDDTSGFGSATRAQEVGVFPALSPAGSKIITKLDPTKIDEQFLRLDYAPTNGDLSTGIFSAFIVQNIDNTTDYPIGYTI